MKVRYFEGRDKVTVWPLNDLLGHLENKNIGTQLQYFVIQRPDGLILIMLTIGFGGFGGLSCC